MHLVCLHGLLTGLRHRKMLLETTPKRKTPSSQEATNITEFVSKTNPSFSFVFSHSLESTQGLGLLFSLHYQEVNP